MNKDLSTLEGQTNLGPWLPAHFKPGRHMNVHGYVIRTDKLFCQLGGRRHHYEPTGRDFKNKGLAGICEVDTFRCTNTDCLRDKR